MKLPIRKAKLGLVLLLTITLSMYGISNKYTVTNSHWYQVASSTVTTAITAIQQTVQQTVNNSQQFFAYDYDYSGGEGEDFGDEGSSTHTSPGANGSYIETKSCGDCIISIIEYFPNGTYNVLLSNSCNCGELPTGGDGNNNNNNNNNNNQGIPDYPYETTNSYSVGCQIYTQVLRFHTNGDPYEIVSETSAPDPACSNNNPPPDNGTGSGGGENAGGGSSNNNNNTTSPQDPCASKKNVSNKMNSVYQSAKIDSVLSSIPNLATDTSEHGFYVYENKTIHTDPYTLKKDTVTTGYTTGSIYTVGNTGGTIPFNTSESNTSLKLLAAIVHSHTPGGFDAHSPNDVYALIEAYVQRNTIQGSFTKSFTGKEFVLTITDPAKALAFLSTKSQYLNGRDWNMDSELGKAFKAATKYYNGIYANNVNQENLAYEMAMAAVFSQFNTGITLNKRDFNGSFNPIVVNTTVVPKQGMFKPAKTVYTQTCL